MIIDSGLLFLGHPVYSLTSLLTRCRSFPRRNNVVKRSSIVDVSSTWLYMILNRLSSRYW